MLGNRIAVRFKESQTVFEMFPGSRRVPTSALEDTEDGMRSSESVSIVRGARQVERCGCKLEGALRVSSARGRETPVSMDART